jgi:ribosome-binding factor A
VRVAERVRAEIMDLLLRGAVKDPRASAAVVTDVRVTDDLRYARVYVRVLETSPSPQRQREVVAALTRAGGFLRRELGSRLHLRHTPELRFEWDEVADSAARIEEALEAIRHDGETGEGDE